MPPPSSPVPRLSSVPSASSTVHTITSRSPLRPLVSAIREMDGRPPRPLLADVIATPRQRPEATGQRLGLSVILPASSSSPSSSILQVVRVAQSKRASRREGRENQCEGCRRHPRQFLSSLPFRLLPHRPHHRQRLTLSPSRTQ